MSATFTVVIPTLNEADNIRSCITHLRQLKSDVEVVVADGGSRDDTVRIAESENVIVCRSEAGRGQQCNTGAAKSSGSILLFLHADTLLPSNAFELLEQYFRDEQVQIGTFRLGFDAPHAILKLYTFFTRFDSLFTRFGDQCIVLRKSFFTAIEGFPDWPLFEDVRLLQVAHEYTRVYSFPAQVTTSARRFKRYGLIRQQLRNATLIIRYLLNAVPEELALRYERQFNKKKPPRQRVPSPQPSTFLSLEETQ